MIMKMVRCPNCELLTLSIPDKSDFYTTFCGHCKEKCIYLTKDRENWIKTLLLSTNYQLWKRALLENNVKLKFLD